MPGRLPLRDIGAVEPLSRGTAKVFIARHHYLGEKSFRASHIYGLWDLRMDALSGVAVFHGVSAPETMVGAFGLARTDQRGFWELGRFVLHPDYNGGNWGSFLLGRAIRLLRQTTPVRAILTYADTTYHVGMLYQATNFVYCGLTARKGDFWVCRDGVWRIKERGKTKGVEGEWRPRAQKHRYILVFDKGLDLQWPTLPYPKEGDARV